MAKTLFRRRGASTNDDRNELTRTTSSTIWPSRQASMKQRKMRNAERPRARLQWTTTILPKQSSLARKRRSFDDVNSKRVMPIPYSMTLLLLPSLSIRVSIKATNSRAPSIGLAIPWTSNPNNPRAPVSSTTPTASLMDSSLNPLASSKMAFSLSLPASTLPLTNLHRTNSNQTTSSPSPTPFSPNKSPLTTQTLMAKLSRSSSRSSQIMTPSPKL